MSGVDGFVQGPVDGSGKKIDNDVLTIGADQVYRQRIRLGGFAAGALLDVQATDPVGTENGAVVRIAGTVPLPTGAATGAKQDTGNASLSSIDGKTAVLVSGRVPVDGSGVTQPVSVSSIVPGVGATNLGKMEDSPAADGDVGVLALSVRQDVIGSMVGANGDYQAIATDGQGRVRAIDDIVGTVLRETLAAILIEMRVQTTILHTTLNCRDDVDALRTDAMQQGRVINEAN